MADDLIPVMLKIVDATEAVLVAQQQARTAGQIERSISLNLVMRSQQDAMLAMAELLESEGTPIRRSRSHLEPVDLGEAPG